MGLRGPPPCKELEHDLRAVRLRVATGWSARSAVIHVAAERGRTLSGLYKAWTRANARLRRRGSLESA